jgi:hypothetical protein
MMQNALAGDVPSTCLSGIPVFGRGKKVDYLGGNNTAKETGGICQQIHPLSVTIYIWLYQFNRSAVCNKEKTI